MSIEATWDLRTNASPRSLCAFPAPSVVSSTASPSDAFSSAVGGTGGGGGATTTNQGGWKTAATNLQQQRSSGGTFGGGSGGGFGGSNPFDVASSAGGGGTSISAGGGPSGSPSNASASAAVGIVFGTDAGSLHYRSFPSHANDISAGGGGGGSNPASSSLRNRLQVPYGYGASNTASSAGGQHPQQQLLPPCLYPMDLVKANMLLPGAIVDCVPVFFPALPDGRCGADPGPPSPPAPPCSVNAFLLLCDDHRATASGAYATRVAALQPPTQPGGGGGGPGVGGGGGFHVLPIQNLPRMSCATYHPSVGIVYAAGRTVSSLPSPIWETVLKHIQQIHASIQQHLSHYAQQPTRGYGMASRLMASSSSTNAHADGSGGAVGAASSSAFLWRSFQRRRVWVYEGCQVPAPGCRAGSRSLQFNDDGSLAVVAVDHSFYVVPGQRYDPASAASAPPNAAVPPDYGTLPPVPNNAALKVLSLTQSPSQVHPVVIVDTKDLSLVVENRHSNSSGGGVARGGGGCGGGLWSCWFLANGRECVVVDIHYDGDGDDAARASVGGAGAGAGRSTNAAMSPIRCSQRCSAIVQSPIVSAAAAWPWLILLTSDGMISIRSPSCVAVPLQTVEVGQQPNDYFAVTNQNPWWSYALTSTPSFSNLRYQQQQTQQQALAVQQQFHSLYAFVAASYSGEGKVLFCRPDTTQDLADRIMRLSIDAFGESPAFPRQALARALKASFVATSYVSSTTATTAAASSSASSASAPNPTNVAGSSDAAVGSNHNAARVLLQQYAEAVLGLVEWESGAAPGWFTEQSFAALSSSVVSAAASEHHLRGGGSGGHPQEYGGRHHVGTWHEDTASKRNRNRDGALSSPSLSMAQYLIPPTVISGTSSPAALLAVTGILCLVCLQLSPAPHASLANRAAKSCANQIGVVVKPVNDDAADVCEQVVDKILREASSASSSTFSLLSGSSPSPVVSSRGIGHRQSQAAAYVDFVEACIWLLRACGRHERALEVAYDKLCRHPHAGITTTSADVSGGCGAASRVGQGWSQIKYESYTATHLSELWATQSEAARLLVLRSAAAHRLLERNPRLGLSVFTSVHPQNEAQWREMRARDDPLLSHAREVVQLLQSVRPCVPYSGAGPSAAAEADGGGDGDAQQLQLDSGRNLAIAYLESAIGIGTGRPAEADEFDSLAPDPKVEERIASFHDELSLLLLEGVIAERQQDDILPTGTTTSATIASKVVLQEDSDLGQLYRSKLKRLLRWPASKVRSETFLQSLPPSFLQEKALVLGRLGRHEDALRILYCDLGSLDLALEYCDHRHAVLKARAERVRARQQHGHMFEDQEQQYYEETVARQEDNAYLPLVRVALEEDKDSSADVDGENRGAAAAIQVLAMRRSAIDRAAALRLLPQDIPVSAVARPFLIPALVDSESQVRRLTVVSALLRARYLRLKSQLTAAQLKAQANIHVVPQLRSLNLGDPLHSTNPFKARTSTQVGSTMPDVMIVKHFFPRHLVIQAKVTNAVAFNAKYERTLSDIAFVVAESSEEAIQPMLQVPIPVLPPKMTGCAWCVLSASPSRMDGPVAQLTCELRFTVQSVEISNSGGIASVVLPPLPTGMSGRTYVEELQDLEVHAAHFS